MRPFEAIAIAGVVVSLVLWLSRSRWRGEWARRFPWLVLALVVVHVALEGARWQLTVVYVLAVLQALLALRSPNDAPRSRGRRVLRAAGFVGALCGVALTIVLALGFPIFAYPAPSGAYGVGTAQFVFVDKSRVDAFAPKAGTPRELLAAVWYPADVAPGAPRDPFWPKGTDAEAAVGLPAFMFSHLSLVRAHSTANAPIAKKSERYPVIVYSHGFNSTPWQNVVQMEELASHGFVVVSIGHTYDASRLTFPDGHVVLDNSRTRRAQQSPEAQLEVARLTAKLDSMTVPDSARATWRHMEEYWEQAGVYVMPSIDVWYDDTRFVIDRLTMIDAGTDGATIGPRERFTRRLDLRRLGVAGMSFGGSTAGVTCIRDARCKAGANLDGWQFGHVLDHPLTVPFLFMSHEGNGQFPVYVGSAADLFNVEVRGTTHGSFADLAIAMPFFRWIATPKIALIGTTDGASIERIMSRYLVAFFKQYLNGEPQPLLTAPAPPNELRDATLRVVKPAMH